MLNYSEQIEMLPGNTSILNFGDSIVKEGGSDKNKGGSRRGSVYSNTNAGTMVQKPRHTKSENG